MKHYYVSERAQATGEHEIHEDGCEYMPSVINRSYLGLFTNCWDAKKEAEKKHTLVDGCYFCSRACHTR